MDLGPGELLVVLAVGLILLGPSRLPKLARSIGEAIHELRHSADEARSTAPSTGPADPESDTA